jgi:Tol biopolymer transport system component
VGSLRLLPLVVIALAGGARVAPAASTAATPTIVAQAGSSIVLLNADGSGERVLFTSEGDITALEVSPDGRQIAFGQGFSTRTHPEDPNELDVMDVDGSGVHRVAADYPASLAWSAQSDRLAFESVGGRVFVVAADGSGLREVAFSAELGSISWAPSGTAIAYTSEEKIAVVDIDSGVKKVLADGSDPIWSPEGSRIAFRQDRSLVVVNVVSLDTRVIDDRLAPSIEDRPAWAPDSKSLAYGAGPDVGREDLYLARADGTGRSRLTTSAGGESSRAPSWSPDGTRIAYERERLPNEAADVYVIAPDGAGSARLTRGFPLGRNYVHPGWAAGAGGGARPRVTTTRVNATHTLRAVSPVFGLAADGRRAATIRQDFGGHPLVWDPFSGRTTSREGSCDSGLFDIALSGSRIGWVCVEDADAHQEYAAQTASLTRTVATDRVTVANTLRVGLAGRGGLLVFAGGRKLWRLDDRKNTVIRRYTRQITLLSADSTRIAVLRNDGGVDLLRRDGRRLRTIRNGGRPVTDGAVRGGRLALLGGGVVSVYDVPTGRLLRVRQVSPEVAARATLGDMQGNLVVYTTGTALRVLRLDTGHDVALALPAQADVARGLLVPRGLFYAYNVEYDQNPGRIGFVPMRALLAAVG